MFKLNQSNQESDQKVGGVAFLGSPRAKKYIATFALANVDASL